MPEVTRLHYPLALAYRGLNDRAKAEEHLAKAGQVGLKPPDPLLDGVVATVPVAAGVVDGVVAGVVDGDVSCGCVEVCELVLVEPNGSVYCWSPAEPPPWARAAAAPPSETNESTQRHTST